MEFVEKHLTKIKEILKSSSGLFIRLEEIASYLVETNKLSSLSIFRSAGDEMDEIITVANHQPAPAAFDIKKIHILSGNVKKEITIIPSKFSKVRSVTSVYKARPEFLIPIKSSDQVVGILHAEKNTGTYFAPAEVRLLKESAKELSSYFQPTVFSVPIV
ncbi:MAG: hypothetical protein DWQ10_10575 [Calditrichaeota bacterium]|nr:MAG: hypothetical protein DWQ10_10575 [Calditrichota bacterium]